MEQHTIEAIYTLGGTGMIITLGKMLLANDIHCNWKVVAGKVILGTALAISSAAIITLVPAVPDLALVGISCGLSLLGLTWFEEMAKAYAEKMIERGSHKDYGGDPREPMDLPHINLPSGSIEKDK